MRIARVKGGDGLIRVHVPVVDVRDRAHVAKMSLEVRREHACVDGGGEFVALRPIAGGVAAGFAGLADANSFQLPKIWVDAEDKDSGVADERWSLSGDVLVVEAGSDGLPIGERARGLEGREA